MLSRKCVRTTINVTGYVSHRTKLIYIYIYYFLKQAVVLQHAFSYVSPQIGTIRGHWLIWISH